MSARFDRERFDGENGALQGRLDELIERSGLGGDTRAVAEAVLSELGVVIEELRSQNAELHAGREHLEAERERYRELFDMMPDGYVVTDRNGIVSEANSTVCELVGRSHDRLVGKPVGLFIADDHRKRFYAELAHLNQGGVGAHLTVNLTIQDDVMVPVVLRAALGGSPDGVGVIKWLFHDRRDELRTDQLRASEERLRVLLDLASVGVVLCDASGRLVYANKYADRLLRGHPEGERAGTWLEATHLDDLTRVARMVRNAFELGQSDSQRHRLIGRDGASCWVDHSVMPFIDPDGRVDGFVSTLIDVTAEHQAKLQLQESRDFTDAVIDNVGAVVLVLDPDLRIRRVNRSVSVLSGFPASDLIGRNVLHTFVPAEQRDALESVLVELAATGTNTFENDWVTAQGERRHLTWTNTTLTDTDGGTPAFILTGADVTEQREFEAQLAQADRLSSIGRMAAGLAHDVNNTLTVLGLRMERLRNRHETNAASVGDLDAVQRSLDHTQALIGDLLAFGGRHELKPAAVEINTATRHMVALLEDLLGSNINIAFELADHDTTTLIDPVRFDQAITNLAINARDAMPNGGTLTIATSVVEVTAAARPPRMPAQLNAGRYVRMTVADTGAGMPANVLSHVFDPYFTTKPSTKGTGLGLAVTYGTITQAAGAISVESTVGVGTTFTIWLPNTPSPS